MKTLIERFWPKVDRRGPDECWEWQGAKASVGYGAIYDRDGSRLKLYSHRVAWEFAHGCIPVGLFVLHRCDNPSCVNPAHLFLGTHGDNMRDRKEKGRNAHGDRHGRTKIPDIAISDIRASTESQAAIARRFGVDKTTIFDIKSGRTRKLV